MQQIVKLGEIGQISRSVKDVPRATAWYRDVLGLPLLYAFESMSFFDCNGARLMLTAEEGSGDSILYFRVESVHSAFQEMAKRGIQFINDPHMIYAHPDGTEEWMAFFNDNEARPLAIMARG